MTKVRRVNTHPPRPVQGTVDWDALIRKYMARYKVVRTYLITH